MRSLACTDNFLCFSNDNLLIHRIYQQLVSRNYCLLPSEIVSIPAAVLQAISCHTLGSVQMNELDKILFLADMIEPGRCYPGVGELRREAFLDLDRAMLLALESSIRYCLETRKILHPLTVEVRNTFLKKVNGPG